LNTDNPAEHPSLADYFFIRPEAVKLITENPFDGMITL
jgi:hypothetical protein